MRSREVKPSVVSPLVFTWDVLPGRTGVGASCGASGKREHAIGGLVEALRRSPKGTRGVVKTATLSAIGDVTYVYGPVVIEAHREAGDSVRVRIW